MIVTTNTDKISTDRTALIFTTTDTRGLYRWTLGRHAGTVARTYRSQWAATIDGQKLGGLGRTRREAIRQAVHANLRRASA